jgi:hypothetical protein
LNVIVPVGVPLLLVTRALKVTDCPGVLGLADDVSVVVVAATGFTVSVIGGDVLPE